MKIQDSQIVKTILRKKNNTGVIMLPDFKSYHKAMTIKKPELELDVEQQTGSK